MGRRDGAGADAAAPGLAGRAPAPGAATDARLAAAGVQTGMLVLCVVVPLLGWAYSSALGFPLVWLGLVPLPDWVPLDRELARAIKPWHQRAAWALTALVLLHLAAALKHHFIDRDGLLRRMAPWAR